MTCGEVDEVPMEAIKAQAKVLGLVMVSGAVFSFAADSVAVFIAMFAFAAGAAANGASKAPEGSADRRFRWCAAGAWAVLTVLAGVGFASRFWG